MLKHIKKLNELQCLLQKLCGNPEHSQKLATHYFEDTEEGTTHYRCGDCVEDLKKREYKKTKTRKLKYLQTKNGSNNRDEYNRSYYSKNSKKIKRLRLERYYKSKDEGSVDNSKRSAHNKAYYEKNKEYIKKRRLERYYEDSRKTKN